MPKYLIISLLQRDNGHTSLQFGRLRSNRFGKNGLTGACRAVFSKQAAPMSHDFFSCHAPLPPGKRCGELRGGLSSRVTAAAGLSALTDEKPRSLDLQSGVIVAHVPADYKYTEASRGGVGLRQYRAMRRFLLPEGELRRRVRAADCKSAETMNCKSAATYYQPRHYNSRRISAAGWPYHPRAGFSRLRGMLMAAGGRKQPNYKFGWTTKLAGSRLQIC